MCTTEGNARDVRRRPQPQEKAMDVLERRTSRCGPSNGQHDEFHIDPDAAFINIEETKLTLPGSYELIVRRVRTRMLAENLPLVCKDYRCEIRCPGTNRQKTTLGGGVHSHTRGYVWPRAV